MATLIQKKPEEGAPCRNFFCTGHLILGDTDDRCYCFKTAPCLYCLDIKLVCDRCGEETERDA